MPRLAAALSLALVGLALFGRPQAASAAACTLPRIAGAEQTLPDPAALDQHRLDLAILARVNYARCQAGLAALAPAPPLAAVAIAQSRWMAAQRQLTHYGGPPGLESLRARLAATGLPFTAGAENIATAGLYRLDNREVRLGPGACRFFDLSGRPIGRQSYDSLAEEVVAAWLASPGHRRNILDARLRAAGAGAGFDRSGPFCGTFYLTQDFLG